jgi:hypothetical protein
LIISNMALGEMLSAVGGNILGSLVGHGTALARQRDAQDFSADQFARRYQITTEDMKKAGLNPMLAYSQGGGNAPTSSAASANSPEYGTSAINAKLQTQLNAAQVANIQEDTRVKAEQAALVRAQTAQASSSASMADANITKIGQEVQNLKEQFKNIPLEGNRLRAAVEQLAQQAGLFVQQGMTQTEVRAQLTALAQQLKSQTNLLDLDFKAAEQLGNIGREFGQLKPIVDVLMQLMQMGRPRGGGITINK